MPSTPTPITKARSARAGRDASPAAPPKGGPVIAVVADQDGARTVDPAAFIPKAAVDMQVIERFRPVVTVTSEGREPKTAECGHPNSHILRAAADACARKLARDLGAKLA